MTAFEFVFGLLSIIASLGLTHVVASVVALIRRSDRIRFSAIHALWMWTAFATTIGNWGSYWALRDMPSWSAAFVLMSVGVGLGQYAFCALVSPELPADGPVDLAEFHERERRRYASAYLALIVIAFVANGFLLINGNFYAGWVRDLVGNLTQGPLALLAIFVRNRLAQWIAAIGVTTASTLFMIEACASLTG